MIATHRMAATDPRLIEGLRKLIDDLDVSVEAFGNSIGSTGETVRRWLGGKVSPQHAKLLKIEEVYGVTIDQLRGHAPLAIVRRPGDARVERDAEPADPEAVERVIARLGLEPDVADQLRRTRWHTGAHTSEGTLQSYAIDLRGKLKGKLHDPPATKVPVREGGMRIPKKPR